MASQDRPGTNRSLRCERCGGASTGSSTASPTSSGELATPLPGWDVRANVAHIVGTESLLLGEQPTVKVDAEAARARPQPDRRDERAVGSRPSPSCRSGRAARRVPRPDRTPARRCSTSLSRGGRGTRSASPRPGRTHTDGSCRSGCSTAGCTSRTSGSAIGQPGHESEASAVEVSARRDDDGDGLRRRQARRRARRARRSRSISPEAIGASDPRRWSTNGRAVVDSARRSGDGDAHDEPSRVVQPAFGRWPLLTLRTISHGQCRDRRRRRARSARCSTNLGVHDLTGHTVSDRTDRPHRPVTRTVTREFRNVHGVRPPGCAELSAPEKGGGPNNE